MQESRSTQACTPPRLSSTRGNPSEGRGSDNHHLWRNGRLWWVAFTIHPLSTWTKERIRRSLRTGDLRVARRRRDAILARYSQSPACTLSLRMAPQAAGEAGR